MTQLGATLNYGFYGIPWRRNVSDPAMAANNFVMMDLIASGEIMQIVKKYFPPDALGAIPGCSANTEPTDSRKLGLSHMAGLFLIFTLAIVIACLAHGVLLLHSR